MFLKLNLQYFAENNQDANLSGEDNQNETNGSSDNSSADSQNTDNNTIPYARFKEVNDNYKNVKQQLDEYQETFKKLLDTKLQQIPEDMKDLIPATDDFAKLQWVENAITKGLFGTKEIKSFGNKGNNPNSQTTTSSTEFIKSLGRKF